ncbi:methionine/alanine import family NSS transporter small subunit [Georgenia faecalis]|uniref:Methionine/alanine import family NSS transporter small subunit n=1 Tax=Georgenia faecalis TaxID=2483799 RepID=A0ABV9D9W7_9MICO|nr:methionine/alanine import family NSS transporter small subunit [Georgenia faecalis]
MSLAAILLMVFAVVVLWGGLVVATRFLVTHPLPPEDDDPVAPGGPTDR